MQYLGLGKTKFNSSVCLVEHDQIQILLTERLSRVKCSGAWPQLGLKKIFPNIKFAELKIAENRDVMKPSEIEEKENLHFPFYEFLIKNKLENFTQKYNNQIKYVNHHLAHAYAVLAISPFEESIILVMDGAGSQVDINTFEECTIYIQKKEKLTEVYKRSVQFSKKPILSSHLYFNQIGGVYETASEYIFNSPNSSGKVMGLAAYGKPQEIKNLIDFQSSLDWNFSFKDKSKSKWEEINHTSFINISASVQNFLEDDYQKLIESIRAKYPEIKNLILTGGCALNCTNNAKILQKKYFDHIFIPPFPGDESISFGLAHYLKFNNEPKTWNPTSFENQTPYLGSISSIPTDLSIEEAFSNTDLFSLSKPNNFIDQVSQLLLENNIIAWFQGRSECGPRALGNRSIIARPDKSGLKDFLNREIKFRESFRPYGCSVLFEKSHLYFENEPGFHNPFMSYAIKVKSEFKILLNEVSHIDGTSRMQTVHKKQNELFYELIDSFGKKSNLFCLLNTSLNIMDEPILETVLDAKRFMENTNLQYLAIGNYLVTKKNYEKTC